MSQPNFRLCEVREKRCFLCQHMAMDSEERAHCMDGTPAGSKPPEQGKRVNENFVCDDFAAK